MVNYIEKMFKNCDEEGYLLRKANKIINECEAIDKLILSVICKNAIDIKAVDENLAFRQEVSQAYPYLELKKDLCNVGIVKDSTIIACLDFLEKLGLIYQVQKNIDKEYCYAINELGLTVVKLDREKI